MAIYLDENGNEIKQEVSPVYLDENGNEIIIKSPEEKRMIAEEMRSRAKTEFAQDMEAQQKAEYESRFESPLGKFVKNIFPYSNPYEQTKYERILNAGKDITSLPGRLAAEGIGSMAEVAGSLQKGDLSGNNERIADIGSRFMDNVGQINGNSFAKNVITDPLLPVLGGVNTLAIPGKALLTAAGKFALGTGAVIGSEYARPGEMTVEDNALPIITGAAFNALPGLRFIPIKGRNLPNIIETRPMVEGAETLIRKTNPTVGTTFVLASEKNVPTKASTEVLKDLWQTNSSIDKFVQNTGRNTGKAVGGTLGSVGGTAGILLGGSKGTQIGGQMAGTSLATKALKEVDALLSDKGRLFATFGSRSSEKQNKKYISDVDQALKDNKLTESEYNAYKNPGNKDKFYQKFSEYK